MRGWEEVDIDEADLGALHGCDGSAEGVGDHLCAEAEADDGEGALVCFANEVGFFFDPGVPGVEVGFGAERDDGVDAVEVGRDGVALVEASDIELEGVVSECEPEPAGLAAFVVLEDGDGHGVECSGGWCGSGRGGVLAGVVRACHGDGGVVSVEVVLAEADIGGLREGPIEEWEGVEADGGGGVGGVFAVVSCGKEVEGDADGGGVPGALEGGEGVFVGEGVE